MTFLSNKGFTLIELLVVISIIGVLASVVLSSLTDARASAQDAKRKVELNGVRQTLEIYYTNNGKYPGETWCDSSIGCNGSGCPVNPPENGWDTSSRFWQELVVNDGGRLPVDPVNDSTFYYYYEPTNDGNQGYFFRARLSNGDLWAKCGGTFENGATWCH